MLYIFSLVLLSLCRPDGLTNPVGDLFDVHSLYSGEIKAAVDKGPEAGSCQGWAIRKILKSPASYDKSQRCSDPIVVSCVLLPTLKSISVEKSWIGLENIMAKFILVARIIKSMFITQRVLKCVCIDERIAVSEEPKEVQL